MGFEHRVPVQGSLACETSGFLETYVDSKCRWLTFAYSLVCLSDGLIPLLFRPIPSISIGRSTLSGGFKVTSDRLSLELMYMILG